MKDHLRAFLVTTLVLLVANPVRAQETPDKAPTFTTEQLEQLVATIALYPDSLVSQILMASTYPLEVVEADRWTKKKDPSLTGDSLAKALNEQKWDASVKSLVNFPEVLDMMSKDLDWMTKLGDAFIASQKDVLAAIQRLRKRAKDAGNLENNDQQKVTVESGPSQTIVIQPTSPDVVYVPTYNPTVVYGAWPYPASPPYAYYPPGYAPGTAAVAFGLGVACGAAWGNAWGDCDWNGGHVDVDVNRNANLNRNVNRSGQRSGQWSHNPAHRGGVSYRDRGTAERFGRTGSRDASRARDQFRGRAESGRRDLARDGGRRDGGRGGDARRGTDRRTGGSRAGSSNRGSGSARGQRGGSRGSAFSRSGSGRSTRNASSRGRSSRGGGYSRGGGRSRGGGARGGGGGRRR